MKLLCICLLYTSFTQMSIFALNITPYITSYIIMQLLTIAIPALEEMQRDGEEGRKKITAITRYVTVGLALFESVAMAIGFGRQGLIPNMNFFKGLTAVSYTHLAENIALQLENRISFRRAMKSTMQRTMKSGAKGIKTSVSGRLGGADMARTEFYSDGTIPLQTLRADIDYGFAEADTTYGKVEMCIRDRETDVSNSRIDCFRKGNLYCISIIDQVLVKEILDSAKLEFSGVSGGMPLVSNSIVYQRDCCKRAFVRGAFPVSYTHLDVYKRQPWYLA